ncbi:MAG TPA: NAD-dependent deacylase [Roseiflexaceae bacterium]|jgi:NAD-dependent deacetylase|nr:NAD-dependent deacylase [Roseiflexaceae bacterium]
MTLNGIAQAAAILRGAQRAAALTGAGISTPSGIPDFRGDGGLWLRDDPMEVASLHGFCKNPRRFFGWFQPILDQLLHAQPNPAHRALAALEKMGKLRAVVTQNIDGLHQRAGSREVYELHGHVRSATCMGCGRQVLAAPLIEKVRRGELPWCACGGLFKPDVVLFEEDLPRGTYWLSASAMEKADAVIVAGTALEVYPACEMPLAALKRGKPLIIVNKSPTYLDEQAAVVIREDVAVALPKIVEMLET